MGNVCLLALWQDRDRSSAEVKKLALSRAAELRERIAVLEEMRRTLEHLAASCHSDDCPIIGELEGED